MNSKHCCDRLPLKLPLCNIDSFSVARSEKGNSKSLWPLKVIFKSKQPPQFLQLGLRQNAAKLRAAPFRCQSFSTQNIVLYYSTRVWLCQILIVRLYTELIMPSHPHIQWLVCLSTKCSSTFYHLSRN